jgi:hypothetical protein
MNEGAVKKIKFVTDDKSIRNLSFLLYLNYNKFELEILYITIVGLKE